MGCRFDFTLLHFIRVCGAFFHRLKYGDFHTGLKTSFRKTLKYAATGEEVERMNTGEIIPPAPVLPKPNVETVEQTVEPPQETPETAEELPVPTPETAPASEDKAFKAAMMQYYRDKDAEGGTKLAEWAGNFDELARRNYENVLRRNPEMVNPAQSFKDSFASEVFNRSISASDAQLPDFAPGSSNLNYSKREEVENSPMMDNAFNDFSRNNISPREVFEQEAPIVDDIDLKGIDYTKLYKSFDPGSLF